MIVLTNGNEDPVFKDYGSAVNTSAVDDWEKMSEKGRVARWLHIMEILQTIFLSK
jgi:hypothetical protein